MGTLMIVWQFRYQWVRILYEKLFVAVNSDGSRNVVNNNNAYYDSSSGVVEADYYFNSSTNSAGTATSTVPYQVPSYQSSYQSIDKNNSNISQASTVTWNETDGLLTAANLDHHHHEYHVQKQLFHNNNSSNQIHGTTVGRRQNIYEDSSSNDSSPIRSKFMFSNSRRPKKSFLNKYSGGPSLPTIMSNTSTLVSTASADEDLLLPVSHSNDMNNSSNELLSNINSHTTDSDYNANSNTQKKPAVSLSVSPATTVATTDSLLNQFGYVSSSAYSHEVGIEVD